MVVFLGRTELLYRFPGRAELLIAGGYSGVMSVAKLPLSERPHSAKVIGAGFCAVWLRERNCPHPGDILPICVSVLQLSCVLNFLSCSVVLNCPVFASYSAQRQHMGGPVILTSRIQAAEAHF